MGKLKNLFGIKEDTIKRYQKEKNNVFKNNIFQNGKVNFAIVIIFIVFFGLAIFFSFIPVFAVKYKIADSAFDKNLEQKIIEDMYLNEQDNNKDLPFKNIKDFKNIENLDSIIKEEISKLQGRYGVYIKNLKNGEGIRVNEKEKFTAASLSKIFVAAEYFSELKENPFLGDEGIDKKNADAVEGNGSITESPVGSVFPYRNLVHSMLNQSDNTAFAMLVREIGIDKINGFIEFNKFDKTDFSDNDTSPEDIGSFFEKVYLNDLIQKEYKQEFIDSLTNTVNEDRIPYYLPSNVKASHKIGTWDGAYSDAGIVFAPNGEYIIVIMTDGADYEDAINMIRKLSKIVYDYFEMINKIN